MHRWWLLIGIAACGGSSPPAETPRPPAEASCASAADNMVAMIAAGKDPPPPVEKIDAFTKLIRERCEQDGWSVEARTCLRTIQTAQDADECGTLLTDAQQQALAQGMPGGGPSPNDAVPPGGGPEPKPVTLEQAHPGPPTPPPPAKQRSPMRKAPDRDSADPCDGGE